VATRTLTLLALACLLVAPAAGFAPDPAPPRPGLTSIFYYPWYGVPERDGSYGHWAGNGHEPPFDVSSSYYPARGPYSSTDRRVLRTQMAEIAAAGIDEVVVSWWGWGSLEDARLPTIARAARAAGLEVAVHLEPYLDRTAATAEADMTHLLTLGISTFYVYEPFAEIPPADWAAVRRRLAGVRLLAQTPTVGLAAAGRFDGVYTYDVRLHDGASFTRLCNQARVAGLSCSPSVGPGYDARRSLGDPRLKSRRAGATYDAMWRGALAARPSAISITSYNEWQEGTQIEPARTAPSTHGFTYESYRGAWGLRGKAAERAYLERTAHWTRVFSIQAVAR